MQINKFQTEVALWMLECFGVDITNSKQERAFRFAEEAMELCQAIGATKKDMHDIVDYVFSRPTGEPSQEVGGVMVTLAALCHASDLSLQDSALTELARINDTDIMARIRAKHAAKKLRIDHSALPGQVTPESLKDDGEIYSADNQSSVEKALKLYGEGFKVFLDGKSVEYVTACKTGPNGWVQFYEADENGKVKHVGGEIIIKTLYGHVELRSK